MWLAVSLALLTLAAAARPTSKTPIVQVGSLGSLKGQEMALSRSQRAVAFLGIPYAPAPVGSNRFKEPQKPWPKWDGTRDATDFKPSCLQPLDMVEKGDRLGLAEKLKRRIDYNEDCLYLNIYVPDGRPPRGEWPVIIWFHPGDFVVGTPNIWDGSTLAIKQKVIIVTASYRLNIFGFLATQDSKIPGNLGLLDQIAVIDWVQEHIKYFNGSKDDVTLWGHSAGAISISLHLISDKSSGKFQRAIIMSGNFLTPNVIKSPFSSEKIAGEMGCSKSDMEKCLQQASPETLLAIAKEYDWGPTISKENDEYTFIMMEPEKLIDGSDVILNSVPVMTGYTDVEDISDIDIKSDSEFKSLVQELVLGNSEADNDTCLQDDLLAESVYFYYLPRPPPMDKKMYVKRYTDMLTEHKYASVTFQLGKLTSQKSETYVYRFDYKMKTTGIGDTKLGVSQQQELPFFWGMPYWATLTQIPWNSQDKRTADIIMGFWGNFTKYSKPVESRRTLQWDPLDMSNPHIFIIDKNPNMSDSETFDYKSLVFWNEYYPMLKSRVEYFCSLHNTANSFYPLFWLIIAVILCQSL